MEEVIKNIDSNLWMQCAIVCSTRQKS